MGDSDYAVDESGLLVPPRFDDGTRDAGGDPVGAAVAPTVSVTKSSAAASSPAPTGRIGAAPRRTEPAPLPPAGKLNWIFGVLGIATGLVSFMWPLLCLTVLVSLALSAVGASRANRLRHRGATGRGLAIFGIVIGLASAANLVFGITQMLDLGSQVGKLLP